MSAVGGLLRRVEEISPIVRADAGESERTGRLGEATVAALRESGLMRMLVTPEYGGASLTLEETFPIVRAISRVHGSTGWNVHIGATTVAMASDLADDRARSAVLGGDAIVAGTLQFVNIRVERVTGGYTFDGVATFLSGSAHASWLAIGGWLHVDGAPQFAGERMPRIVRGVVPIGDVSLQDTWHVSGLRATSSHDATLDRLFVPDEFICSADGDALSPDDPARRMPLFSRFGAGVASVALGIADGALDATHESATTKTPFGSTKPLRERAEVQIAFARATALVASGSAYLDHVWHDAHAQLDRGDELTPADQARLRLAYLTAADHASSATDLLVRAAGTAGLYESDGLERCWRDANAVNKHVTVTARSLDRVGRILLGLPPPPGPI